MPKLIIAFRKFANVPKIYINGISRILYKLRAGQWHWATEISKCLCGPKCTPDVEVAHFCFLVLGPHPLHTADETKRKRLTRDSCIGYFNFLRTVQRTRFNVSQFIYFCKTLYMFQTVFQSIIRNSKLHIQRQAFVKPLLLPAASHQASSR